MSQDRVESNSTSRDASTLGRSLAVSLCEASIAARALIVSGQKGMLNDWKLAQSRLVDYCNGIRKAWTPFAESAKATDVVSVKIYWIPDHKNDEEPIWVGYSAGYGDTNHISQLIRKCESRHFSVDKRHTVADMPIRSFFRSLGCDYQALVFKITNDSDSWARVPTGAPHILAFQTTSALRPEPPRLAVIPEDHWGSLVDLGQYLHTEINEYYEMVHRAGLHDSDGDARIVTEIARLTCEVPENRRMLRTSKAVAEELGIGRKPGNGEIVTTALAWPPCIDPCVIGVLYSREPLCPVAMGFFSAVLSFTMPLCELLRSEMAKTDSVGVLASNTSTRHISSRSQSDSTAPEIAPSINAGVAAVLKHIDKDKVGPHQKNRYRGIWNALWEGYNPKIHINRYVEFLAVSHFPLKNTNKPGTRTKIGQAITRLAKSALKEEGLGLNYNVRYVEQNQVAGFQIEANRV